ncbi:MAG: hypothetical protein ACRDB9_01340 [Cetobacterium sp.]
MDKLKEVLTGREKNKDIINLNSLNFEDELFFDEDGEYLKQKSYEVALINVKGSLALGKIFKEVFEKLGNSKTGTYEKWIVFNGFNKRTALRYRKKFELYQAVSNEKKEQIALMSFELVEKISNGNVEEYIELINNGISNDELKAELKSNFQIENKEIRIPPVNFDLDFKIFKNIENEIENLDKTKKMKVEKLLVEIQKILEK